MIGHLQLFVLGKPRILLDNQPLVDLVSVKAQALLFYLAVTGKEYSRSALAGLLWGDLSEESARANLRLTLSKLRKAIPNHLAVSWQSITFNFHQPHTLDFNDFLTHAKNPERLRDAMDLYRGDFLEDFIVQDALEFETWMLTEREHLRHMALKTGWQLTVSAHERGAYAEGIEAAWKVLSIEPWHEETHQQLMQSLAASGQRSAALAQYDVCRHVLAEELGVEPSPFTTEIYEQIKNNATKPSVTTLPFPPLADSKPWQSPTRNNLPIPLTPLVGRETEHSQIIERITDTDCRLLTILGPGGIGKTRLAVSVAESLAASFPDGVAFVSLEEVSAGEASEKLIANLANALSFTFSAPRPPRELILDHLADKAILLVMDNMESLRQNDKLLAAILQHAPKVKILVTSRQRLGVAGEWLFELKGLSFATHHTEYASAIYPAVQLFVECARRLRPDFDPDTEATSINRICQLVDGFPLGIELAAQWVIVLPCAEIVANLERSIDMLTANLEETPERHHSLRLVMNDSWNSLTMDERRLFRCLSIFHGGFDLAAAEQVAGATLPQLAGLVNKSWLQHERSGRYHIHELLRQYGVERLTAQSDEELTARNSHARYYADFLLKRQDALIDRKNTLVSTEIDLEVNNLRFAWEWYLTSQQIESIKIFIESLWNYYQRKGWFQEAAFVLEQASSLDNVPAVLRGSWRLWLGEANYQMGRIAQSEEHLAQALLLLGEKSPNSPDGWGWALFRQIFSQVLHRIWPSKFVGRKSRDRIRLLNAALALSQIGPIAYQSGDGLRTLTAAFWDLNLAELAGSPSELARAYAGCCISLGSLPIQSLAEYYGQLALSTAQSEIDLESKAYALEIVGLYHSGIGHWLDAKPMLEESTALHDELVLPRGQIESRSLLAKVHFFQGQFIKARNLYKEALLISGKQGDFTGEHWNLMGLAECALCMGESNAEELMTRLERVNTLQNKIVIARADMIRYFGVLAQTHFHRGEYDQAFEAAQTGLRMIKQKPFAGSWTMEGYAGVAETFLSLWERSNASQGLSMNQTVLKVNAREAYQAMHAFSHIFLIAQPRAWLCQGRYDWITGKHSQANHSWQKGLGLARQLSMPYEQARTHHEIGRHLNDEAESKLHLQIASDIYAELGILAKVT